MSHERPTEPGPAPRSATVRDALAHALHGAEPASCIERGFVFKKRDRLSRPGSCPVCGSQRIDPPRFRLEPR